MRGRGAALSGVAAGAVAAGALGAPCGVGFDARTVATGVGLTDVEVADVDADGALDLVVSDGMAGEVIVRYGVGDGTFSHTVTLTTPGAPVETRAGDLDGDGVIDLVALSVTRQESYVSVFLGAGARSFGMGASTLCDAGALALDLADIDGDMDPDAVLANTVRSGVSALLNLGGGALAGETIITTTPSDLGVPYVRVLAMDLDLDGIVDLAANSYFGDAVHIAYGVGAGAFDPPIAVPVGPNPSWLDAVDLNNDGRPDLLTTSQGDDEASVVMSLSARAYAPAQHRGLGFNPRAIAAGDVDGDAIPDVICAGSDPGALAVFRGVGDGTLRTPVVLAADGFQADLELADLNNDGRLDLALVDIDDETVNVLENTCPCPADLDPSGAIDSRDLAALLAAWGTDAADLDGDGDTGSRDLAALLAAWGVCP